MDICLRDGGSFPLCTNKHKHTCACMCAHMYRVTHPYSHEPSIPHMSTCVSLFTTHVQGSPDVPLASSCAHIQHIYTCLSLYASHITCPNIHSHAQNHTSTCSMCHTPLPSLSCISHNPLHIHTHSHTHPVPILAIFSDTFSSLVARRQSTG